MTAHRQTTESPARAARLERRSTAASSSPWLRAAGLLVLMASGCGTTKNYDATEQLLLSEAVDNSIAAIDFRPMTGHTVFLDTRYINQVKSVGFVNSEYVISSLRQQITGAGCLLQDTVDQADIVIEARVGTLGADSFQVIYGIPANSALSSAAQILPAAPAVPMLPELSLARRESREGAAKIAAFAYDRVTRQPLWQSGMSRTTTTSRDTWVLGVGPIQTGSIRGRTRLIGSGLEFGNTTVEGSTPRSLYDRPPVNYAAEVRFDEGMPIIGPRVAHEALLNSPPGAQAAENTIGSGVEGAAAEPAAGEPAPEGAPEAVPAPTPAPTPALASPQ